MGKAAVFADGLRQTEIGNEKRHGCLIPRVPESQRRSTSGGSGPSPSSGLGVVRQTSAVRTPHAESGVKRRSGSDYARVAQAPPERHDSDMPAPGKRWRHIIINTRCAWLHGSVCGFRSRKHRIHSSGDYKHRPPTEEHEGLRRYHRQRSGDPIEIPIPDRERAGRAFLARLRKEGCPALAIAVAGRHLHALTRMIDDRATIRAIIGRCKSAASYATSLTGQLWSELGEYRLVKDRAHQHNAYEYILTRQGPDAWTWSFRDERGLPRMHGLLPKNRRRGTTERSGPSPSSGLGVMHPGSTTRKPHAESGVKRRSGSARPANDPRSRKKQ